METGTPGREMGFGGPGVGSESTPARNVIGIKGGMLHNGSMENGQQKAAEPIDIIGLGMRLPGGIHDAHVFWDLLVNKRDARTRVPDDRYNTRAFYGPNKLGHVATEYDYFLDDVDLADLDARLFSMTKNEIEVLDPQQRQLTWTIERKQPTFTCTLLIGVEELSKSKSDSRIQSAEFSHPVCTAVQLALVDLLRSWGVSPHRITGHSGWEIAAAYACNAISAKEAIIVAFYRGKVTKATRRGKHRSKDRTVCSIISRLARH